MSLLDTEDPARRLHARAVSAAPLTPGRTKVWLGVLRRHNPERALLEDLERETLLVASGAMFQPWDVRRHVERELKMFPPFAQLAGMIERTDSPG